MHQSKLKYKMFHKHYYYTLNVYLCIIFLPWSPVRVPQRTGIFGALDTENVSVAHVVFWVIARPLPVDMIWPPRLKPIEVVMVVGPVITKLVKSSRIYKFWNSFFHSKTLVDKTKFWWIYYLTNIWWDFANPWIAISIRSPIYFKISAVFSICWSTTSWKI